MEEQKILQKTFSLYVILQCMPGTANKDANNLQLIEYFLFDVNIYYMYICIFW